MKLRISTIALALAFTAAATLPAAAADKETRQMMADIRMLQEQAQQLQNMVTTLIDQIKTVDTRLSTRLDQQTDVTQKALADQKTAISSISNDVRTVREKVDDNSTRVGSLALEIQAIRQLVTSRPSFAAPDASDSPAVAGGAAAPSGPSSAVGASPQKLWDSAFADYTAGQFDLAINGFEDYIKSNPTSPQADEAQATICNAYLIDGKYEKAVEACDLAIRNYPNGTATPKAYYRKGMALKDLKEADRAREAFTFITKNFPSEQEATLAQQALDDLKDPKKP